MSMFIENKLNLVMNGACGLESTDSAGFDARQIFISDTIPCWAELETTDLVNDSVSCNPAVGEVKKDFVPVLS